MILRQILHTNPAAISYLLGCGGKSVAAVVDPVGDSRAYLDAAAALGMRLRYVIDTHVHADHLSPGRELAAAAGAEYVLFAGADVAFPFAGVASGDELELGNVSIRILHTPGHTPEHISLLVTDQTRSPEPWCLLTGHMLMVGDLGRTELAASQEAGARLLFRSARLLKSLPDHVEIFPGAYSGSVCGRGLSGKPSSTIGFEKLSNPAFMIDEEEAFVAAMKAKTPPPPPDAAKLRAENSGRLTEAA
jgi:glyoxylase-like metal-dependent hydrolase (beta-lactamase superfamily II)